MILTIIILSVIAYFVYDTWAASKIVQESQNRILDKLNSLIDGVKTFFTVTLVERLSSPKDTESEDDDIEL